MQYRCRTRPVEIESDRLAGRVGGITARRAASKSTRTRNRSPAARIRPSERAVVGGCVLEGVMRI
jgi:hypothetical protein